MSSLSGIELLSVASEPRDRFLNLSSSRGMGFLNLVLRLRSKDGIKGTEEATLSLDSETVGSTAGSSTNSGSGSDID